MKTTNPCRGSECSAEFIPDPRVGDRQVTCGAPGCQRARHAKRCREWHAANKEAAASHYEDVVVRFREQQPDYQRRWRWGRRLREIREKTALLGGALLAGPDRKSTRLNSSHVKISYAVFCLKKKRNRQATGKIRI